MKNLNLLLVFLIGWVSIAAAQSSQKTFDLKNFDQLSLGSAFEINVKQGNGFRVVASGDQRDLDDLEGKVSGGTLVIKYTERLKNRSKVSLEITMPSLSGLDLSGATTTVATGFSGGDRLKLDVSGASKLKLNVSVDALVFDLSGASSTTLVGKATLLKGDISGASSLKARDFPVKEVEVDASGASSVAVNMSEVLTASASGASKVRYSGPGKEIKVSSSGASSVKRGN